MANQVYSRIRSAPVERQTPAGNQSQEATQKQQAGSSSIYELILLKRYQQDTEDLVVEYLRKKTRALRNVERTASGEWSDLEQEILNLPSKAREDIINKNESCERFLTDNTKTGKYPDVLYIRYGLVTEKIITCFKSFKKGTIEWFEKVLVSDFLLKKRLGSKYHFNIDYSPEKVPLSMEVAYTCCQKANCFTPYELECIKDTFQALKSGLAKRDDFEQLLVDNSLALSIDELALRPLKLFNEKVAQKEREEKIIQSDTLQSALRKAFGGYNPGNAIN